MQGKENEGQSNSVTFGISVTLKLGKWLLRDCEPYQRSLCCYFQAFCVRCKI